MFESQIRHQPNTAWRAGATSALLLAAHAALGAGIALSTERRADAIEVAASALLEADAAAAWGVLTDYERYVEFIPGLRVSRVVSRRGSTVTVEQSGEAVLWLLRIPLDVTYEIAEFPPTRVVSRAVGGSLRTLESSYRLTPIGSGVRLDYSGRIAPGLTMLGPFEQLAVEQNIARRFQALADEIERRSGPRARLSAPDPAGARRAPAASAPP